MNEKFPKQEGEKRAMEGREIAADGKDLGDKHFHEVGFGTTAEEAKQDLERMVAKELEIAEQQAEKFVTDDLEMGIRAYEGLIAIYKTKPEAERWKLRLKELKKR